MNSHMQPYQQRVVDEKSELDDKLDKLAKFIGSPSFTSLDKEEQMLLICQKVAMRIYSTILEDRITAFAKAQPTLAGTSTMQGNERE